MTSMSSTPGFAPLKFVSEAEIEEKRKKRQEEWEKVRQPHQPLEAPEEAVETRSLYEQLQAQKEAKQLEYDEQHRLKNQIHGLDKEEVEFLDFVHDRQQEIEKERHVEEMSALQELHNSVSGESAATANISETGEKLASTKVSTTKKRPSQAELLAGAVKRKRSDGDSSGDQPTESSEPHGSDAVVPATSVSSNAASQDPSDETGTSAASAIGVATVVGILPGLGDYTDSDRSDTSSSDSEIDMDVFRREVLAKHGQDSAATSATVKHRHH